ncbi:DUF3883 domain-containing protein [Bacilli bacterium]|nr:DUF3883 domain-containing protein [Bacilli bacterium]PZD86369.1 DUF3883 domain-containing protein [Bacilli bacterium]PZD89841.1 DUF3883 domain-containing protein [Bacilli bacterium]RCO05351.1 DUF3883 domain-containing protein [Bacilli bacterium]RCO10366.1 DUF3883 domain-containing protein [Bacilli bacterium]
MFSVGILYSVQHFLTTLEKNSQSAFQINESFQLYYVATIEQVVNTSLENEWVILENGMYKLTTKSKEVLSAKGYEKRLRIQLKHMIETLKPTWFSLFHRGRKEAIRYFPPEVLQCFDEADLLYSYNSDVIEWWDYLSSFSRKNMEDNKLIIGRQGERLSVIYEKNRTGFDANWVSVESNLLGYDILSRKSSTCDEKLKIEVKSTKSLESGKFNFYLTRNEWDLAINSINHIFHFWILEENPKLYVYNSTELKDYIPVDNKNGKWQLAKIKINKMELEQKCRFSPTIKTVK